MLGSGDDAEMSEQSENLERVTARIGGSVVNFCRGRVGRRFFAEDLHQAVLRDTGLVAPASADRILRNLRQRGVIGYKVVSRHESLYEIICVGSGEKKKSE